MTQNFKSLHYYLRNSATQIKGLDQVYMMEKVKGSWVELTYREVLRQINALSAYLLQHGLEKQDKVALIIENSPEYICFDQALMQLGLVNVSIYPTLSESEVEYIINNSEAKAILVGSPFLWKKINSVKGNCPELKLFITAYETDKQPEGTISYKEAVKQGEALYPAQQEAIEKRLESVTRDDLACLLYTSGTTGKPKGAMLTHNNFITNVEMAIDLMPIVNNEFRFLSFLPMSHVYERTATYYCSIIVGAQVAFAQSLEALSGNIMEVQPTALLTVPRLMERIEERVRKTITQKGGFGLKVFNWAFKVGEQRRHNKEQGRPNGIWLQLQLALAEKLVFSKIKAKLGGKMKLMISGGGAMPQHVGEFFANMGVTVCEGYGLTETSPLVCVNEWERQVFGAVGRIGKGCEVAIQNPETKEIYTIQTNQSYHPAFESPEGEILVRGVNVMKGYWKMPEATAEAIDKDGWLHTGDVGKFYKGYLKITDRIKNILVNSFGKNVYPTPIENTYLLSPKIEQIFLIGDNREYLTAIIIPSREEMKERFKVKESYFAEPTEFIDDKEVYNWLLEDMKKLEKDLGKFERIKHFIVKRKPFSIETGELTPKQSVKRKVVEQKYAKEIDDMYALTVI